MTRPHVLTYIQKGRMGSTDTPKVSSIRYWKFIFPILLLIVLISSLYFIMEMPDTVLTSSSAFVAPANIRGT